MAPAGSRAVSVRSKLVVNSVLAIAFVAISAPQATRIPAHEWLSFAFIGILALHILFSWSWIVGVSRRLLSSLRGEVRFNYLLDAASYLAMIAVIVSGIVISESALPTLGFPRPHDRFWSVIHDRSSEWLLVLIGVHLAMHCDWVLAALRRLIAGSLGRIPANERRGSWTRPVLTLSIVSFSLAVLTVVIGRTPFAEQMRQQGPRGRAERGAERGAERRGEGRPGATLRAESAATSAAPSMNAVPDTPRAAAAGANRPPRSEGGGNQLGWRQRYLRPAIKIATYMGGPFLLTLLVSAVLGRARPAGGRVATVDPLKQRID
ncbi:MAG: DUF4405 domain-containing protein [Gemmatimonadota bacterium]